MRKPAAAAAELGRQRSRERKKTTERGRMKKDLKAVPIYEEKTDREGASIFGMVIKDKDLLGYD